MSHPFKKRYLILIYYFLQLHDDNIISVDNIDKILQKI